jgi:hypothetical protein
MEKQIDLSMLSLVELKALKSDFHDQLAVLQQNMNLVVQAIQRKIAESNGAQKTEGKIE